MLMFIAINFNNDTRSQLLALRDELSGKSESGRFSLPENLHLTLAFLGECDGKQDMTLSCLCSIMEVHGKLAYVSPE